MESKKLSPEVLDYLNGRSLTIGKTKSGKYVYGAFDARAETYVDMGYNTNDHIEAAELHVAEAEAHSTRSDEKHIFEHHMAMFESHKDFVEGRN